MQVVWNHSGVSLLILLNKRKRYPVCTTIWRLYSITSISNLFLCHEEFLIFPISGFYWPITFSLCNIANLCWSLTFPWKFGGNFIINTNTLKGKIFLASVIIFLVIKLFSLNYILKYEKPLLFFLYKGSKLLLIILFNN